MSTWYVTTFYKFTPLNDPEAFKAELRDLWAPKGLRALVILAVEGINATVAAPSEELLKEFKSWLQNRLATDFPFKDSVSEKIPFRYKMTIKIRPEIVSLKRPDLVPESVVNNHLNSQEWEKAVAEGAVLIDTRNTYESDIGTFKNALIPPIKEFSEFGEAVEKMDVKKDQKILIFCTGGIRCEKAILEMNERGYENVYQLEGGILKYLEETDGKLWDGECFVFDNRVAVTKDLQPTQKYSFCPHCGNPAEQTYACGECGESAMICAPCLEELNAEASGAVCSKNCRYHAQRKKGMTHATPSPA